jgi:hypothetical protein
MKKQIPLTQKELKESVSYDPSTGIFTWLVNRNRVKKGDRVGWVHRSGYSVAQINGHQCMLSRLAFLYMEGYFPEHDVDHKDRNKLNNKWDNLRHVTRQCNCRNVGVGLRNTSGVVGIVWEKTRKKWRAYITVGYRRIWLGRYNKKHDAIKARWDAEVKFGFPNCNTTSSALEYLRGRT